MRNALTLAGALPAALLWLTVSTASAQTAEKLNSKPARSITLGEAINVAVQKNPGLARTKVDKQIAETDKLQASGIDDWVFGATGTWLSSRAGLIEGAPFQVTLTDSLNASSSLSRALKTGGTVGIHADAGFARNEYAFPNPVGGGTLREIAKGYNVGIAASLSQPLLRGRGERIARANVRRAAIAGDRASLARRSAAIDMVSKIINAYWELAYAVRELQIRKAAVGLAQKQLAITKAAKQVGSKAASDVRAVEHGIAVREQAVLQARINISERSLTLRRLSGLEIGPGHVNLGAASALKPTPRRFNLDTSLADAKSRNPRIALLRVRTKEINVDAELARDAKRSSLDLTARIGPTGNSSDVGDMFKQFVTVDSFSATATLTYRQTLKNRSAAATYRRAQLLRRRLRFDLAETEREVSVQVVRAVNLVRLARKRIEVANKAIKLAEQNYRDEKLRFDGDEATNFDVLQRQNEIQKAQLDAARAVVDYLKALATVDALTGDLLRRYGVKLL